jgi:hypothetical protein
VLFGADRAGVGFAAQQGARLDLAQFWMGAWNEPGDQWGLAAQWARQVADAGSVPVAQWYYWAGDISPSCVSHGCWGHGVWKDQWHWNADAAKLADALHQGLHGRPGMVVLESEFNKQGVQTWDPFDAMLVRQASIFRAHAPEVKLVLGFGNWNPQYWPVFDQAAHAVDLVGFQTMRGATRDSYASYMGVVDSIQRAVVTLRADFGKPVVLYDLALSSFWEPQWAVNQNVAFQMLFARLPTLQAEGLRGVILRSLTDDPTMTTAEYYGWGERSMGLRHADGSWKPAMRTWLDGVKAARGGTAGGSPGASGALTWQPRSVGNPWWVDVATPGAHPRQVWASVDGGSWHNLPPDAWGTWAASFYVPGGTRVTFHARLPDGSMATSAPVPWG